MEFSFFPSSITSRRDDQPVDGIRRESCPSGETMSRRSLQLLVLGAVDDLVLELGAAVREMIAGNLLVSSLVLYIGF
jgi:hypothetical protein